MTKTDKIVIVIILVFAAVFYAVFNGMLFENNPEKVVISVDGSEYASYRLSEISGTKTVRVETEFGVNVVEITNSGVQVVEASCPDKLDVHSGRITKSGQMIVCLPNRLTVKLDEKNSKVDKVTY